MKLLSPRRHLPGSMACCFLALVFTGAAHAGVVAHWSFDQADTDGSYPDSVNNAHPAMPSDRSAVPAYSGATSAPFGGAVTFLGPGNPNSYLTIPPLTNIQTTSLTVAAWVNLTSQNSAFLMADWPNMNESGFAFGFHPFGANKATAQPIGNISSSELMGGRGTSANQRRSVVRLALADKSVPLNEWHHVAFIWDRDSGTMTFYLDGASQGDAKRTPTAGYSRSPDMVLTNHRVRIGSQELAVMGTTPAGMTGSLDELWIFDEALTPIQLRNLIKSNDVRGNAPVPPPVPNTTTAIARGGPDTGVTPGSTGPAVPDGVSPPAVPRTTSQPVAVGATAGPPSSPARLAGILLCLTVIITLSCYLIWAFAERAKLHSSGGYR